MKAITKRPFIGYIKGATKTDRYTRRQKSIPWRVEKNVEVDADYDTTYRGYKFYNVQLKDGKTLNWICEEYLNLNK